MQALTTQPQEYFQNKHGEHVNTMLSSGRMDGVRREQFRKEELVGDQEARLCLVPHDNNIKTALSYSYRDCLTFSLGNRLILRGGGADLCLLSNSKKLSYDHLNIIFK